MYFEQRKRNTDAKRLKISYLFVLVNRVMSDTANKNN